MKVPRITGILSVVLICLTFLNFILKSYTYFAFIINSDNLQDHIGGDGGIAQDTGDEHHPQTLFVPLLTFIPCKSPVITRPWVLLTSGFVHEGVLSIPALALIFYLGKYVENLWGTREFLQFVIITTLGTNTIVYCYYKTYINLFNPEFVPPVVQGSMPMIMGLLVAVKQRISNHYIIFFQGSVRIKVTYIPFLIMCLLFVLLFFDDDYMITFFHAQVSFIISWVYLRFFKNGSNERQSYLLPFAINKRRSMRRQRQNIAATLPAQQVEDASVAAAVAAAAAASSIDSTSLAGDRSVQFSLYTFFPYPLSLVIKIVSQVTFQLLVKYKLINANAFSEFDDEEEDYNEDADSGKFLINQIDDVNSLQLGFLTYLP